MSAEVAEVAEESEQKPRLGSVHELWCTYTKDAGREVWGFLAETTTVSSTVRCSHAGLLVLWDVILHGQHLTGQAVHGTAVSLRYYRQQ